MQRSVRVALLLAVAGGLVLAAIGLKFMSEPSYSAGMGVAVEGSCEEVSIFSQDWDDPQFIPASHQVGAAYDSMYAINLEKAMLSPLTVTVVMDDDSTVPFCYGGGVYQEGNRCKIVLEGTD
jgi:hypothetical protein